MQEEGDLQFNIEMNRSEPSMPVPSSTKDEAVSIQKKMQQKMHLPGYIS